MRPTASSPFILSAAHSPTGKTLTNKGSSSSWATNCDIRQRVRQPIPRSLRSLYGKGSTSHQHPITFRGDVRSWPIATDIAARMSAFEGIASRDVAVKTTGLGNRDLETPEAGPAL